MANRNFPQSRQWGFHLLPRKIDAIISIGASGAPTIVEGSGIASITRLAAGQYQVQLQDNYKNFQSLSAQFQSPVAGSAVNGGSFIATTVYQIVTLGTTTQAQWVTAGVPAGITAAPGVIFLAAGIGAGSGTVKALGASGISSVEVIGGRSLMLSNQPNVPLSGGFVNFQCIAPTSSSVTTQIATDPASGSVMYLQMFFNDSSVQ